MCVCTQGPRDTAGSFRVPAVVVSTNRGVDRSVCDHLVCGEVGQLGIGDTQDALQDLDVVFTEQG